MTRLRDRLAKLRENREQAVAWVIFAIGAAMVMAAVATWGERGTP